MAKDKYLCIESPDSKATIDFLGKYGVVITAELRKNKEGEPTIYVMVKGCDDRATILGEILAVVPETDEGE